MTGLVDFSTMSMTVHMLGSAVILGVPNSPMSGPPENRRSEPMMTTALTAGSAAAWSRPATAPWHTAWFSPLTGGDGAARFVDGASNGICPCFRACALDRQFAVHDDAFAVGVAGHFARLGVTPQGNPLDLVVVDVFVVGEGAGELGLGQPWEQGVDPNP
jgi:hypothetical protein